VRYRLPRERPGTFKEYAIRRLQRRMGYLEFWALRDIDLQVEPGETLGVIGANGAGKSTLLKVIARALHPSQGRVRRRGRVAPLLDLGAGFHPELSGRENVYLNGLLLGYTRSDIQARFERIVDFAELWDFIDAPLRTYSSGMLARLGFAVATDNEPDILLVDEVLAVGDAAFSEKSRQRLESFRRRGATILLVSHAMETIRETCDRAVWLERGELRMTGQPEHVAAAYLGGGIS
jgi:ABC-2 type transport system ATP-binding protein